MKQTRKDHHEHFPYYMYWIRCRGESDDRTHSLLYKYVFS